MSGAQRLRGGQQRSWADGVAEHDSHSLKAVGRFSAHSVRTLLCQTL